MKNKLIFLLIATGFLSSSPLHAFQKERTTFISGLGYDNQKVSYEVIDGNAVIDGDIIIGSAKDALVASQANSRGVGFNPLQLGRLWKNKTVYYYFVPPYKGSNELKERIFSAMDEWKVKTGINFVEYTGPIDGVGAEEHYAILSGSETQCSSSVGIMSSGYGQGIFGEGCDRRTVLKYIGHALGLLKEETRFDRDDFVTVNWENVSLYYSTKFDIALNGRDKNYGYYDYQSIMHSNAYAFSKNGQPTLTPLYVDLSEIGQGNHVTAGDANAINKMYSFTQSSGFIADEYVIDKKEDLEFFTSDSLRLKELLMTHTNVTFKTSDHNWIQSLELPQDVRLTNGQKITFVRDAGYETSVTFNGNQKIIPERYSSTTFKYKNGRFYQQHPEIENIDKFIVIDTKNELQDLSSNPDKINDLFQKHHGIMLVTSDNNHASTFEIPKNLELKEGQEFIFFDQSGWDNYLIVNGDKIKSTRNTKTRFIYKNDKFNRVSNDVITPGIYWSDNFSTFTPSGDSSVYIYIPEQDNIVSSSGPRHPNRETWGVATNTGTTLFVKVYDIKNQMQMIKINGFKKHRGDRFALEDGGYRGYGQFQFVIDKKSKKYRMLPDSHYKGQFKAVVQGWHDQEYKQEITIDINFDKITN
ncbi:M12 family metallopeptidase [Cysteiniphilum litorale]|uniref:M12 family metallopeptidase n=1 Tax=Cysteiniphilum litorale TaxID=2056700 RepID=UPI003F8826E2